MGRDVPAISVSQQDRRAYREKVRRCLDVFARMLRESRFETEPQQVGLEIELNLVDEFGLPSMKNTEVLGAIADPSWASELGQFNLEINVAPRELTGDAFAIDRIVTHVHEDDLDWRSFATEVTRTAACLLIVASGSKAQATDLVDTWLNSLVRKRVAAAS